MSYYITENQDNGIHHYYWPASWTSIVLLMSGRPPPGRARERSGGRHYTAGQYDYVPLRQRLVNIKQCSPDCAVFLGRIACTQCIDAAYCNRYRTLRGLSVFVCSANG